MVALNEKFSHSGVPASEGRVSPHEIDAFDFTKWSGEVWGGSVVNFGGAGFCGLSDAPPLRRRSAAPVNRNDPESELHYVRNRTYSPALCTVLRRGLKSSGRPGRASKKIAVLQWIQRGPIGYSGGINLYEYVGGRAATAVDPMGLIESYTYHEGIQIGHPKLALGPLVRLPSCPKGVSGCCAARTGTFRAFLGTIVTTGSPTVLGAGVIGELIKAAVKGVAATVPATKLVDLWTDDLSFNGVRYIWDMYAVWTRTVTYSYCCGTSFQNLEVVATENSTPTLLSVEANRTSWDQNNFYRGGTSEATKKHLIESIWDMLKELTKTVKGE